MDTTSTPVPAPEASTAPSLSGSLTSEQEKFTRRWSFGALMFGQTYFLANGLIREAWLMFIPIYNIYLWAKGIFRGRRMSWEKGEWVSFESYQRRQKALDKMALVILLILAIIIPAVIIGSIYQTVAPAKAAESFFVQVGQGQIDQAYNSTTEQFKEYDTVDSMKAFVDSNPDLGKVTDAKFKSREIYNSNGRTGAEISGDLVTSEGKNIPIVVVLEKVDNTWRVAGFSLDEPAVE